MARHEGLDLVIKMAIVAAHGKQLDRKLLDIVVGLIFVEYHVKPAHSLKHVYLVYTVCSVHACGSFMPESARARNGPFMQVKIVMRESACARALLRAHHLATEAREIPLFELPLGTLHKNLDRGTREGKGTRRRKGGAGKKTGNPR